MTVGPASWSSANAVARAFQLKRPDLSLADVTAR
jgi:hypothetical protein